MSPPIPHLPRRVPTRIEVPEGGVSEADATAFAVNIANGYGGRAQWRNPCAEAHCRDQQRCVDPDHHRSDHELLDIRFHPILVNHLPPGVSVLRTLDRPDGLGMHPYTLVRDHDRSQIKVVRSGLKRDTDITTEGSE